MAGIYISGLEMPEGFAERGFVIRGDGRVRTFAGAVFDNAIAIPVPDHGRLIDADAALSEMWQGLYAIEEKAEKEMGLDLILRCGMQNGHAVCVDAISNAPTIIPASGGAE